VQPLVADGAMGTELLARSGHSGRPAQLNLTAPELVSALHADYIRAGAQLIVANTLGATSEEAKAGVRLAREACAPSPLASHPTLPGRRQRPGSRILHFARSDNRASSLQDVAVAASLASTPAPSKAAIQALAAADIIMLETVTSLTALEAAVSAIQKTTSQPLWVTFSFDAQGKLHGLAPADLAHRAQALGLAAFGYGCGYGLKASLPVMAKVRAAAPDALLIAKPNLGLPRDARYDITPQQAAQWGAAMAELGVQIIGLCCGSTPAHIRAVAGALPADC
jgi:5-methyltetrahydrofolate--homocysteine methyltransferase